MNTLQQAPQALLEVTPWHDPVVEKNGYVIGDPYIEMFWLPVLGPTATWLLRRLATGLEHEPHGYTVALDDLARGIGRALQRCVMFGVSQQVPSPLSNVIAVRTILPALSQRHLARLPDQLRNLHQDWSRIVV